MLLQHSNGAPFATGAIPYVYQPVTADDEFPRVSIRIRVGVQEILAFIDTGGIYCFCSPMVGRELHLYPEDSVGDLRLLFRGVIYHGHLHRILLTLMAAEG